MGGELVPKGVSLSSGVGGPADSVDRLEKIVAAALAQDRLSGLSAVLRSIARSFDSVACILWELEPESEVPAETSKARLFTLAEWTESGVLTPALHDLPLQPSLTGTAILEGTTQVANAVPTDERVHRLEEEKDFFARSGCNQLCSVPLVFADAQKGALNLYRRSSEPFSLREVARFEQVARLLPGFYRVLRDRVSFALLRGCNEKLREAEDIEWTTEGWKDLKAIFQEICEETARCFNCKEVSIFLEDPGRMPDRFERVATTWKELGPKQRISRRRKKGLTTHVLGRGEPLRLFDLKTFSRERSQIKAQYPALSWDGLGKIQREVRKRFVITPKDPLPPLSFLAVPIWLGRRVVGAIRCFAASGPYYFGVREQELLELLAQQIGEQWAEWLHRRELQEENDAWKALVNSVTSLNHFVHKELSKPVPDEIAIFAQALRITQSVIRGAQLSDIRLYDEDRRDLYFAAVYGSQWDQGTEEEVQRRKERRFGTARPAKSAGAWVYLNDRVRVIEDVKKDDLYDETFANTRRMILAPISVPNRVYGVLDIRSSGHQPFPPHAESIAELLGKQLGLYHYLAITIGELRALKTELADKVKRLESMRVEQEQAFEDLAHQLRSPINQAHQRVQAVLRRFHLEEPDAERQLLAIRGLTRKATRVSRSVGLFVALARGESLSLSTTGLAYDPLIRLLIEAAEDSELLVEPHRRIRFQVERDSFVSLRRQRISVDWRLLEQAIGNLYDNAGKYSFSESTVRIFGSVTGTKRFQITVANRGLRLRSEETEVAKRRNWRSEQAELTTQEGSGIGLWLVDEIMTAHGGQLVIQPTDSQGWTEVKLVFPIQKGV